MSSILIRNIGKLISGNIHSPFITGDALLIRDGVFKWIGSSEEASTMKVDTVIDAKGAVAAPGLLDSHCHVGLTDYTPRQQQIGFMENALHGGVTTLISAGEVHIPGRPTDPAGAKALAILAAKIYRDYRPGGIKVLGGAVILEEGLTRDDFREMAAHGVRLVGEIGLGSVSMPDDAAVMAEWAQASGMIVTMHVGGPSSHQTEAVTAQHVLKVRPRVASHINGGPTAISRGDMQRILLESSCALELVYCGNPKALVTLLQYAKKVNALDRIIVGSDSPSGSGVTPLGVLRVVGMAASLAEVEPEQALCMATGNTAGVYGLRSGLIKEGRPADLVILDAPAGGVGEDALQALEQGDVPAVSLVLVDGRIVVHPSRNTPKAKRPVEMT